MPLTYARLVQPVMERTCVPCHLKENKGPRLAGCRSLMPYVKVLAGTGTYGTADSKPGEFGAHASKLGQQLLTTHKDRVSAEEKRRLIVWMDANSLELGALQKQPEQRAGQVVWPLQEVDPSNPIGIETLVASRWPAEMRPKDGAAVPLADFVDTDGRTLAGPPPVLEAKDYAWAKSGTPPRSFHLFGFPTPVMAQKAVGRWFSTWGPWSPTASSPAVARKTVEQALPGQIPLTPEEITWP